MSTIISGSDIQKMLKESIPGYKPIVMNQTQASSTNKASMETNEGDNIKGGFEPVKFNDGKGQINNNKTNLDLEYPTDPGDKWRDRVKKGVVGDPTFGNKSDKEDSATSNEGSEDFFNSSKDKNGEIEKNKHTVQTTGLVSQHIDMPKKSTAFENTNKPKKLIFKNTTFLGESHMLSLIPEMYKQDGINIIMKDKLKNEYLIGWKIIGDTINEGVIKSYKNDDKLSEEFNRIKQLYMYNPKKSIGAKINSVSERENVILGENIKKIKTLIEE